MERGEREERGMVTPSSCLDVLKIKYVKGELISLPFIWIL
jgi:hypothetical protein